MVVHKTVSVRMSEGLKEYCESQGDDFTKGLVRIIEEHREGIKADIASGVEYLANLFKSVEFRDPEEL